jgi:type I restriction enzyme R subunit
MSKVGQVERATQERVVKLFVDTLGYRYLGNWQDRRENSNVEVDILKENLKKRGYSDDIITRAINEFKRDTDNESDSLYDTNKKVYTRLRYGIKFKPSVNEKTITVHLIDWLNLNSNDFAIAEEVTVNGQNTKRPDIVVYINGIAIAVLELKRSTVLVSDAIHQNLDNQQDLFIKSFFTTMQLVIGGNDTQGLRYGTIETPEKYYLAWKEDNPDYSPNVDTKNKRYLPQSNYEVNGQVITHLLDCDIVKLLSKERLIDLIYNFILFDAGIKKICRPNQYFGVKEAQKRIKQREGGIIWHTQGSGKSLTMVYLTKWIREYDPQSRVLIITDRTELDDQIESIYRGVEEGIYRTTSGADLIDKLTKTKPLLMCSLIHKFTGQGKSRDEGDVNTFIEELNQNLPRDFKAYGNFYVFVDECHRTQSGLLHSGMRTLLPNAIFIGFTGTPLLKVDKQIKTSIETFGTYIHTYKYDEAVKDGVVLDLYYEARDINQNLESPEEVDAWFESKTEGLINIEKERLKKRWGTMQRVLSSEPRLQRIVNDIIFDMDMKPRLMDGRGNAMLVAGSIYEACKFYELFLKKGFSKCAIITSYNPNISKVKGETTGEGDTEELEQYAIYQRMLKGKSVEIFEQEVKKKFIEEPAQMKLLIVVDKLLTGFDAPSATYLYIDKPMQNHGLFQAICRVNRLDGDDKEYGYIIDYKDLFKNIEQSITVYTSGAFEGFDKEDIKDLLTDYLIKGREHLEMAREQIKALCEPVAPPKGTTEYIHYFCGEDTLNKDSLKDTEARRVDLYKYTVSLIRAYSNLANNMQKAKYSKKEIEEIRQEVDYYEDLQEEIKLASGDIIDLKMYEPGMRRLLDTYIQADKSRKVSAFDDMSLVQLIVERGKDAIKELPDGIARNPEAVAETIENNVRRVIINKKPTDQVYYDRMSDLLDTLIQERKTKAIEYEEYLAKIIDLTKQVRNPSMGADYPRAINTSAKRALYNKLENEALALAIHEAVQTSKQHGWRNDSAKERRIMSAIYDKVNDTALTEELFKLISNQREY